MIFWFILCCLQRLISFLKAVEELLLRFLFGADKVLFMSFIVLCEPEMVPRVFSPCPFLCITHEV